MNLKNNQCPNTNRKSEIEFLRDFDLLTTVADDEILLYEPAKIQIGQTMMKQNFVLKQDGSQYSLKSHIDEFKKFGPGIYLLFKLLKFLTLIFGAVSLLAIAIMIMLLASEMHHQYSIKNEFKSGILKTTIYNLSQSDYNVYCALDFLISIILTCSLIYWCQKEKAYTIECLKQTTLASYSTVILKNLPKNYKEHQLKSFLQTNFGEIAEIYTIRNFGQDLLYYKEMCEIVNEYKEERALSNIEKNRDCHKLVNLFFEFRNGHYKLKEQIKNSENYKPCFAFIKFKKIQDREKLLQFQHKMNLFCCLSTSPQKDINHKVTQKTIQDKYKVQNLKIKQCDMQPCGIIWQNIHLTRGSSVVRTSVMILMMIVFMALSIFLIILLSVMQMSVINSKFNDLSREQIVQTKDSFALLSYCVNLSLSQFYQQSDICSDYKSEYFKLTIMIFLIPISISLFKLALTEIMKALVNFRRYAYQIQKIESQTTIIFVFYFAVTGIFQLVIYLGTQSMSVFNIFTPFIKQIVNQNFDPSKIMLYTDYVPNWYVTASSNIIMIGAVSFNLSALGIIFYCKIRTKIFRFYALKQKIQIQMNEWLKGYTLQIDEVYAAILTIVYFTLLYGANLPLLYVFAFISFAILFWSYKYIFINFCQKPLTYNHSINKNIKKIMFGALILHCIFTPIFLKAPGIANLQDQKRFIQRVVHHWYYLILLSIIIVYLLIRKPIKILLPTFKQLFKKISSKNIENQINVQNIQEKSGQPKVVNRRNFALPSLIRKRHNELENESYSMHENQFYKDILKTLYTINNKQRARKSCQLNQQLFHLYADNIKTNDEQESQFKTLVEVIKAVRKDYKKFSLQNKKVKNPYEKSKKKLYEIYENSKRNQNKKYTLFCADSNGFAQLLKQYNKNSLIDEQIQQNQNPSTFSQPFSNGTKTRDLLLTSNLEKVIQQPQYLQASIDNKNQQDKKGSNSPKSYFHEQKIPQVTQPKKTKKVKKVNIVQIPQTSQNRLNRSQV